MCRGGDDDREGAWQEPVVLYDDAELERPEGEEVPSTRDVRSVAHMKMLQSLGGKLNRLNDVRQIGHVIATELRSLIDYHNCRVSIVDGDDVIPIAFVGQFTSESRSRSRSLPARSARGAPAVSRPPASHC